MLLPVFLMAFLSVNAATPFACPTIAEQIAARPAEKRAEPLEIVSMSELLAVPFEKVNASASLVVEGPVTPLRTYVSKDGCMLLTDYEVVISQVHRGNVPLSSKPGLRSARVIVTTQGGQTVVGGVQVSYRYQQLPPFTAGQTLLLMLAPDAESGERYVLAAYPYGAFEVKNEKVRHLLQSSGFTFGEMEKPSFMQKLKSR